ncbi:GDP-mannose 4,6-dehydratase [Portibacter marinus]|uniref:GDP-mannose 4,6-dehydratase n=1 Tax=Portibacter marinus TaxID=2898660 RepID=UPI001F46EA51|nr:GDP-mannose 4,6-dehydratase [Portibacter marinus]
MSKHILITGGAGFIGSNLSEKLINLGHQVLAIDNFDTFYHRSIKEKNIKWLLLQDNYKFFELDILDYGKLKNMICEPIDVIIHIAAKAGVHASVKNPIPTQRVNVIGTQNMLELAKILDVSQFIFASSSSVYGINPNIPWKEDEAKLLPISPYACSKLSSEMLGHVYSNLYKIRFIGLRFFTVYGPRQRPDLAISKFARMIKNDMEITQYGDGTSSRDYTYIDDLIAGVVSAINYKGSLYEIINLGNHKTVALSEMIGTVSKVFNRPAKVKILPMQPGDVTITYADLSKAQKLLGYEPKIEFEEGVTRFKDWFLENDFQTKS